jgi:hypothetical protein
MPEKRILVLALCSNTKAPGGVMHSATDSVLRVVSKPIAASIRQERQRIYRLIKSGAIARAGIRLIDQPYNQALADGPDFALGGRSGLYLPAVERYAGRFWTELGTHRRELLSQAPFRLLIVSGLYGLVMPGEEIQRYSCHINDHSEIGLTWRGVLTEALRSYIVRNDITDVVDVIGEEAYRVLVAWQDLKRNVRVVHCYGAQNAGPDSLRALGALTAELAGMSPAQVASALDESGRNTTHERVLFSKEAQAPRGAPREEIEGKLWVGAPDQLSRMRRNIIRMLRSREGSMRNSRQLMDRIRYHQDNLRLDQNHAERMREVERLRRRVEYEGHHPTSFELDQIALRYAALDSWARNALKLADLEQV